ncbi:MAG: hypothetical protein EXR11_12330 [Rhodospirillaceae bacterium]|nr:hypothetical protein [Rhodospirillaceae bacterium]
MIDLICRWLAATPASKLIQDIPWVVPATQSAHILSISIVLSAVAMMNWALLRRGAGADIAELDRRFIPAVWIGLGGLFLTGLILIVGEPARELKNFLFWTKMGLVVIIFAITWTFHRSVEGNPVFWQHSPRRVSTARYFGIVSMLIWVAIVAAGRWIAFVGD